MSKFTKMAEEAMKMMPRMRNTPVSEGVANVLSTPARMKSNRAIKQSNYDTKVLKTDRANKKSGYRYNPNEGDYTDPKFRTAVEAIHVRDRLTKKKK